MTDLIAALSDPAAYREPGEDVEVHETHISTIFLTGDFAYKVKRPVRTDFLDYSTLEKRYELCHEELRLDRRYAEDLYLDVVPICLVDGQVRVEAEGEPIEYAVKMRRFPQSALLSERLDRGKLTTSQVHQLAVEIAKFHRQAERGNEQLATGWPDFVRGNFQQMLDTIEPDAEDDARSLVHVLRQWSEEYVTRHDDDFRRRVKEGFIRECHGDLHLQNVVLWRGRLVPFDGIEFNPRMRWIDVLCDSAFLVMDFAAHDHLDLARSFANAYLEQTGDYGSLATLRWYLAYRSVVRALVASLRSNQQDVSSAQRQTAITDCHDHLGLAFRFTLKETPALWITHGVSGSGKSTLSELVVQRHDCVRLRSDIERKRLFGLLPTDRPSSPKLYSEAATIATYNRLAELATAVFRSGYSVIVDATFLKATERLRFHELAEREGVSFAILDCHADTHTLRQRVADRQQRNEDASDADVEVLEYQLASREPLSPDEQRFVIDVPDTVQVVERL